MDMIDYSARVSIKRSSFEGYSFGKFLYVCTDTVYPGSLAAFWSSRKTGENPAPDDRSTFNFYRSDFYWYAICPYDDTSILLTTELTLAVICPSVDMAAALFAPRENSLLHVPLAPWTTTIPDVKPEDRRDGMDIQGCAPTP